jgi:hypothetical protein
MTPRDGYERQMEFALPFLAEQHLVAAKLVRKNGATCADPERKRFLKISNSLVVCVRLSAAERGGVNLDNFDWSSFAPDWNTIEEQVQRLSPPHVGCPPLAPNL